MRWLSITLLGTALFLGKGCVRIPTHDAQCQLYPTPSLEETINDALSNELFTVGQFPQKNWWEMFEDQQLNELIHAALHDSPTLKKAEEVVKAAEAETTIQRASLFPMIGFSASVNWEHYSKNSFFRAFTPIIPGNITETNLGLDFSYEFDFWGKNRNFFRASLGMAGARLAEKAQVELILSISVASSYYQLQWYWTSLDVLRKEQSILSSLLELTKLRQDHAIDNELDILGAEQLLFAINQSIFLYEQYTSLEDHHLKILLGRGPETDLELIQVCPHSFTSFPLPQNISTDLLAHRPDLMALIWQVESTAHLVGAAKADFYPSVNLVAFAGFDSVFFRQLFDWKKSRQDFLTPSLYLPIFTAGRIRANVKVKYAEFEQAINAYNERLLQAVEQVANQIVVLKTADEELREQQRIVQNQEQLTYLTSLRYEYAINNKLDLLRSELQMLAQQLTLYQMEYKKIQAALTLVQALGGGYTNE